jgi:hypothetical protein
MSLLYLQITIFETRNFQNIWLQRGSIITLTALKAVSAQSEESSFNPIISKNFRILLAKCILLAKIAH